jgi:hypothetical protein
VPVEEIIAATRSIHGYLASPISDNISEMPDGSLLAVGCPIARTGFQAYAVKDLPQDAAVQLGIDVSNPNASIDLYRPPEEVFHPAFLASLNGRPITDNHPPGFVTPENFHEYAMGHIQNVRKGAEPLEDGEWPVIADLVISGEPLVSKVRNKTARDVSLGYDYAIRREGKKIIQCDMSGNHAAVVPKGRAGDFVSIADAAPETSVVITPPAVERAAATVTSTAPPTKKEKMPVSNLLKTLHGMALKAFATDADPEQMAEAAEALNQSPPANAEDKNKARDRRTRDNDDEEEEIPVADKRKTKDRKKVRDFEEEEALPAMDAHRRKMHDALDDLLDQEETGDRGRATDADLEELKNLLGQYFSEEETEPAHAGDDEEEVDTSALDDVLAAEEEEEAEPLAADAEEDEDEGVEFDVPKAEDAEEDEDVETESGIPQATDRARAADAASGARAALATLRPIIARSNDASVKKAFNIALDSVTRSSRASTSSYGRFSRSARARDERVETQRQRVRVADSGGVATEDFSKVQKYYDDALKGGK